MITWLANPQRFLAFSRVAAPILAAVAGVFAVAALWLGWSAPDDYQQGSTVRLMFIHVPAASAREWRNTRPKKADTARQA